MQNKLKIIMQKSYGLCDANGMVGGFVHSNVINVEPKSTKHDELTLERVESNLPRSLKDHFCPPKLPQELVLTSLLSLKMCHLSLI